MEYSGKNLHPIVGETLNNFFNKTEKQEFSKLLTAETDTSKSPAKETKTDQTDFQLRSGPQTRYQIDLLITFAQSKFQLEKLLEFLIYLGQLTITSGENQIAIEIEEKIIRLCDGKAGTKNIAANAQLAIGEIYSRQAQWELSINHLDQATKIFQNENDTRGTIECQNILGTIQGDLGSLEQAKKHFENALVELQRLKDLALIGKVEINLGIIHSMQSNYDEALSYLKRAMINFEQLGDVKRIAEIKQNIGMVFTRKKEFLLALKEFDESIEFSIRSNYLQNLGISYLSKAYVYTNLKDFDLAEAFSNKAMEIAYRINDKLSIAEVYKIKGIIDRNLNKIEASENALLTSYRLNKELGNQLNLAETAYELGILFKQTGEALKANQYLIEALGYFRKINAKADIEDLEKLIIN